MTETTDEAIARLEKELEALRSSAHDQAVFNYVQTAIHRITHAMHRNGLNTIHLCYAVSRDDWDALRRVHSTMSYMPVAKIDGLAGMTIRGVRVIESDYAPDVKV